MATKRKSSRKRSGKVRAAPRKPAKPRVQQSEHARLAQELEVHQVELRLQTAEVRKTRRLIEAALDRYTEVFDFAPIGYAILDRQRRIRELNDAGAALLGAERGRLVGRSFVSFVDEQARMTFEALLRQSHAGLASASSEFELIREGKPFPARLTASVLRREQPTMLLAFVDISERRRKDSELAQSEAALREMNRRKDDFLGALSHELRNHWHRSARASAYSSSQSRAPTRPRRRSRSSIGPPHI